MIRNLMIRLYLASPRFVVVSWRGIKSVVRAIKAFFVQTKIDRTVLRLRRHVCGPISVGFYVVSDTCFQLETVFQMMMRGGDFIPKVVVVPNMTLGEAERASVYTTTFTRLSDKYPGMVIDARGGAGEYEDVSSQFDIIATMNPYDALTLKIYGIEYLAEKGIPVLLSRYYQEDGTVWGDHLNRLPELSFLWRFYQGNEQVMHDTARHQRLLAKRRRLVVVGEPKIDRLKEKVECHCPRKRIILAPHHSIVPIGDVGLQLSNFVKYASFIMGLPQKYPEIDWIFRPHPLLMPTMVSRCFWTEAERSAWLDRFVSFPNVNYMTEGDYYDAFLNSDGMIQDCGSFLPEYFYVGKPQCYVLKSKEHELQQFTDYGRSLLDHVYRAYCEEDIVSFIENVVLAGKDPMKESRENFTENTIKYNYPHASEAVLEDIRKALGIEHVTEGVK